MRYSLAEWEKALRSTLIMRLEPLEPRVLLSSTGDVLVISQVPGFAVYGQNIGATGQAFKVDVLKTSGGIDTTYNGNVTISFSTSPPSITAGSDGPVTGDLTVQAVNGIATFSNVVFSGAGFYNTAVTDDQGDPFDGGVFQVSAPGTPPPTGIPDQLLFTGAPTVAADGTFSVTLQLLDYQGNPVAAGSEVLLEILSGPEGSSLYSPTNFTLSAGPGGVNGIAPGAEGNSIEANVGANGLVIFSGLSVNITGTYTLVATSYNNHFVGAFSASFTTPAISSPPRGNGVTATTNTPLPPLNPVIILQGGIGGPVPIFSSLGSQSPTSQRLAPAADTSPKFAAAPVSAASISDFSTGLPIAAGADGQLLGIGSGPLNIESNPSLLD
jgi:hypothetical protein